MEMKVSMKPEMKPFFASGTMMEDIRFQKLAPAISAASSSSTLMESILAVPDLLAKGKCLTTEVSTIRVKVPYREGISPPKCGRENMEKYMVEKAMPLIR